MSNQTDILICGAGAPGLTLGILLAQSGLPVTIIDPFLPPLVTDIQPDGRTAALMQGSLNILRALGVWQKCEEISAPLEILRIIDDKDSVHKDPLVVDFKAPDIGLNAFGHNIPVQALRAYLAAEADGLANMRIIQDSIADITFDPDLPYASAQLASGRYITARLVIGADGRNSMVRKLASIDIWERDYRRSAITCLLSHTMPHNNISTEFHRPSGPFTLVPMPGNQCGLVWVDTTGNTDRFMAMSRQDITQAIQDRSAGRLGEITLATPPKCWPLKTLKADRITGYRVALMAEAAHVMSPMGAQGLNLSLRDCAILAETIIDAARLGLDYGLKTTLEPYESKRYFDIESRIKGSDGLIRMVANDSHILKSLRRAGLKTLSPRSPLKNFIMQQGLAPRDDDSRLMQGLAL